MKRSLIFSSDMTQESPSREIGMQDLWNLSSFYMPKGNVGYFFFVHLISWLSVLTDVVIGRPLNLLMSVFSK